MRPLPCVWPGPLARPGPTHERPGPVRWGGGFPSSGPARSSARAHRLARTDRQALLSPLPPAWFSASGELVGVRSSGSGRVRDGNSRLRCFIRALPRHVTPDGLAGLSAPVHSRVNWALPAQCFPGVPPGAERHVTGVYGAQAGTVRGASGRGSHLGPCSSWGSPGNGGVCRDWAQGGACGEGLGGVGG